MDLDPEKPELRKTCILKSLYPEKLGRWKTWTRKSLDTKNRKKQLDVEKRIEDHNENLLRRDL